MEKAMKGLKVGLTAYSDEFGRLIRRNLAGYSD